MESRINAHRRRNEIPLAIPSLSSWEKFKIGLALAVFVVLYCAA